MLVQEFAHALVRQGARPVSLGVVSRELLAGKVAGVVFPEILAAKMDK
jgi:hypothetical protein